MSRLRLVLMVALATVLLLGGIASNAAAGPGWGGADGGWQGRGSIFLPGGQHVGGPTSGDDGNGCDDACSWYVAPMCSPEGASSCAKLGVCPAEGQQRFTVWFIGAEVPAGSLYTGYCASPGQRPVTSQEIGLLVTDRVRQSAPALAIGLQPRGGALTQLPTIFRTGQPRSFERTDQLAGLAVRFRAVALWRWSWGDGASSTSTQPGGTWPDMSVSHTYRQSGRVSVHVQTTWSAQFWVAGTGPYTVGGSPVRQDKTRSIRVRQARAVLVTDD